MYVLDELTIDWDRAYISVSIDGRVIQKRLDNNEETHQEDFAHLTSWDEERIKIVVDALWNELQTVIDNWE